jgi:hypothetical protein
MTPLNALSSQTDNNSLRNSASPQIPRHGNETKKKQKTGSWPLRNAPCMNQTDRW